MDLLFLTITLVLPANNQKNNDLESLHFWIGCLKRLYRKDEEVKKEAVFNAWKQMNLEERLVFNKLITGGFRVGVYQRLIMKALAQHLNIDEYQVAIRLSGNWDPDTTTFYELLEHKNSSQDYSRPYPFHLSYALDHEP